MSAPDKQMIERVARAISQKHDRLRFKNDGTVYFSVKLEPGMSEDLAQAALSAITPPNGDEVRVPRQLYDFLMGEGSLDGVWFGDYPLPGTARGAFWWRKALARAALAKEKRG